MAKLFFMPLMFRDTGGNPNQAMRIEFPKSECSGHVVITAPLRLGADGVYDMGIEIAALQAHFN